jgi:hypothetical protein
MRAEPGLARREPKRQNSEPYGKEGAHGGNPVSPMLLPAAGLEQVFGREPRR